MNAKGDESNPEIGTKSKTLESAEKQVINGRDREGNLKEGEREEAEDELEQALAMEEDEQGFTALHYCKYEKNPVIFKLSRQFVRQAGIALHIYLVLFVLELKRFSLFNFMQTIKTDFWQFCGISGMSAEWVRGSRSLEIDSVEFEVLHIIRQSL